MGGFVILREDLNLYANDLDEWATNLVPEEIRLDPGDVIAGAIRIALVKAAQDDDGVCAVLSAAGYTRQKGFVLGGLVAVTRAGRIIVRHTRRDMPGEDAGRYDTPERAGMVFGPWAGLLGFSPEVSGLRFRMVAHGRSPEAKAQAMAWVLEDDSPVLRAQRAEIEMGSTINRRRLHVRGTHARGL